MIFVNPQDGSFLINTPDPHISKIIKTDPYGFNAMLSYRLIRLYNLLIMIDLIHQPQPPIYNKPQPPLLTTPIVTPLLTAAEHMRHKLILLVQCEDANVN